MFHLTMETTQKLVSLPARNAEAIATPGSGVAAASADSKSDLESVVIALFDAFHGRVLNYVLTCGLTFHDAEDVVQETFLLFSATWNLGVHGRTSRAGYSGSPTTWHGSDGNQAGYLRLAWTITRFWPTRWLPTQIPSHTLHSARSMNGSKLSLRHSPSRNNAVSICAPRV